MLNIGFRFYNKFNYKISTFIPSSSHFDNDNAPNKH
jgi:hypothetical protein